VSLLFLEEGESAVKLAETGVEHRALAPMVVKGHVHINSRSLIFEPNARDKPVVKYCFRDFEYVPEVSDSSLTFRLKQHTVLPSLHNPRPYQVTNSLLPTPVTLSLSLLDRRLVLELFMANSQHRAGFDVDQVTPLGKEHRSLRFFVSRLCSLIEKPLIPSAIRARRVIPLLALDCLLYISTERLYYETQTPFSRLKSVPFSSIHYIFLRRYRLKNVGFEVILHSSKRLFFAMDSEPSRDDLYGLISQSVPQAVASEANLDRITSDWVNRTISNYEYLLVVNEYGGRSVCDLAQYPVFPWVLADYTSEELDLKAQDTFRDLSKPLGALHPARLEGFKMRYADMSEPKFLYGSHYSNAGCVIGYLLRKHPLCALSLHVMHT
jgi:factor associated with neutral sphingomyelinase activation